jgi:NADH-quinone oxidoreductase subunit F
MTIVHRVLHPQPIVSFEEYLVRRGGSGLETASALTPDAIIEEIGASGLRGRGGAGFPTGTKWRTVADNRSAREATTVVVNAAEGEPGTFKDRTILRINPYQVVEGALIAARAVGSDQIIFGIKHSFVDVAARLRLAIDEIKAAGWTESVDVLVFEGPDEYLYGEETALLETIDGRHPFPRIAPPFRRGAREMVGNASDATAGSGLSAHVEMAGSTDETDAPPTLVNNVETLANVAHILARGASWFRTEGTAKSPGTIVCTITGSVEHAGVSELIMGTSLRDAIHLIGGGPKAGHQIKAVLPGASNALIRADQLDTPLTYEAMTEIGSGLGSAGFIVFDESDDMAAVAAGVSRFLAVESCGQCTPCKQDGLVISGLLEKVSRSHATEGDVATIRSRLTTIADGARCYLATQHQVVVASMLDQFGDDVEVHLGGVNAVEPTLIAELVDISDGVAHYDEGHRGKQPDWTFNATDSGQTPADRFDDHRMHEDGSAPRQDQVPDEGS